MTEDIAMYIILNNDLQMNKGKLVSQGCHTVSQITRKLERLSISNPNNDICVRYKKWIKNGEAKIILKGNTQQLEELLKLTETEYVIDAGKTQIPENSLTAVGFYPNFKKNMSDILSNYKLL